MKRPPADSLDVFVLAVPGALAGTYTGLSVGGKVLAQVLPAMVNIAPHLNF